MEFFKEILNSCLKLFFVTHLEVVLLVEISWKFEASIMKNRGENEKWKIVEKNKKKKLYENRKVFRWNRKTLINMVNYLRVRITILKYTNTYLWRMSSRWIDNEFLREYKTKKFPTIPKTSMWTTCCYTVSLQPGYWLYKRMRCYMYSMPLIIGLELCIYVKSDLCLPSCGLVSCKSNIPTNRYQEMQKEN